MENHVVQMKRRTGRPITQSKYDYLRKKRENDRDLADERKAINVDFRRNKVAKLRQEMGYDRCCITGEEASVHLHHIWPSTADKRSRRILSSTASESVTTIMAETRLTIPLIEAIHNLIDPIVDRRLRRVEEETELTEEGRVALRDVYCYEETHRIVRLGRIFKEHGMSTYEIIQALRNYYKKDI